MYDFIRVAAAVPPISLGDTEYNASKMIEYIKKAETKNADLIVFPELSITGFTLGDLFLQESILSSSIKALKLILKETTKIDLGVFVGLPISILGQIYNCAAFLYKGKVLGVIPKTFIANYNEFYEKRWFSSSVDLKEKNISSLDLFIEEEYEIPVGRDLIFNLKNRLNVTAEICEDLWSPIAPSTKACLNGCELVVNLSASNETIAKRDYRRSLVKQQSASSICAYIYCSSGSDESTTDLIFSGHSLVAENGSLLNENKKLIESDYILYSDIDYGKIKADRRRNKTFKDAATLYTNGENYRFIAVSDKNSDFKSKGELYDVKKYPFVLEGEKDRERRCLEIFEMQVESLKKRIKVTNAKLVVGVSGGLDSTLALLVAKEAAKELDKPEDFVTGITMPCFGTTNRTYNNSLELIDSLKIVKKEINIKEACIKHYEDIGHDISVHDVTYENVQARERTQVLMDYASEIGGLVVGTGDLSELALGFCTYNADHMSMYGVNLGIPKTLVKWMIESIVKSNIFKESTEVLKDIIDTPISPELLPPDKDGNILQETESIIGPYTLHDFYLYYTLRYGFEPEKIFHLAVLAFKGEYTSKIILKWMKLFYSRFFTQQFKRSCLPDGAKIGSICLSPRGDLRMPSDASSKIYIKKIEEMEKAL